MRSRAAAATCQPARAYTPYELYMLRIAKTQARKRFAEVLTRAGHKGERVKITHYGKTLAVVIPTGDLRKLQDCEEDCEEDCEGGEAGAGRDARSGEKPRTPRPARATGGRRRALDPVG